MRLALEELPSRRQMMRHRPQGEGFTNSEFPASGVAPSCLMEQPPLAPPGRQVSTAAADAYGIELAVRQAIEHAGTDSTVPVLFLGLISRAELRCGS